MIENVYKELKVGDKGVFEKTVTESDICNYAGISGDFSWLHVNKIRAAKGFFRQRIAHGMLITGFISNIIGNVMPGSGTIYETQNLQFLKPCFIDDTVRTEVEIVELLPKGRVRLSTRCYNQDGELLINGEAIAIPPREHILNV